MKHISIQTIEQQIASLSKEDKVSHKILVKDFMERLGLKQGSSDAIALGIVKGKRKQ